MSQRKIPQRERPVSTSTPPTVFSLPSRDKRAIVDRIRAKALDIVAKLTGQRAWTLSNAFIIPPDVTEAVVSYLVQDLGNDNVPLHMRQTHALTVGDVKKYLDEYLYGPKPTPRGSSSTKSTQVTSRTDAGLSNHPIRDRTGLDTSLNESPVHPSNREEHRSSILDIIDTLSLPNLALLGPKSNEHREAYLWFLETPQYRNWTNSDKRNEHNGILWIKGRPGSGKSTLMKFLETHVSRYEKWTTVVSFSFDTGESGLQRASTGLYRTLLAQLFRKRPDLRFILDKVSPAILLPHAEIFRILLEKIVANFGKASLVFFIDALDECLETEIRGLLTVLGDICHRAAASETFLRVCLTSRHIPFSNLKGLQFTLEAYGNSIVKYLEQNLRIGNTEVAEKIRLEIQNRSTGKLNWAIRAVNWVQEQYAKGTILENVYSALCRFPDDHEKLPEPGGAYKKQLSPSIAPETLAGSSKQVQRGQPNVISCDGCKKRKIKCDAKRPQCTSCVRTGNQCPGYSSSAPGHIVVPLATATDLLLPSGLRDLMHYNPASDFLILDVRPTVLYTKSHIRGALNICVPTPLQRRATFTLDKFQKVLETEMERAKFATWSKVTHLVIYNNTSSERDVVPVSNMFEKFMHEGFGGRRCLLKGGFQAFAAAFPTQIVSPPYARPEISKYPPQGNQAKHSASVELGTSSTNMEAPMIRYKPTFTIGGSWPSQQPNGQILPSDRSSINHPQYNPAPGLVGSNNLSHQKTPMDPIFKGLRSASTGRDQHDDLEGGSKIGAPSVPARSTTRRQTVVSSEPAPTQLKDASNMALAPAKGKRPVSCKCNSADGDKKDNNIVRCVTCKTWQHIECYYPRVGGVLHIDIGNHSCEDCRPRTEDRLRVEKHQTPRHPLVTITHASERKSIKQTPLAHRDTRRSDVDPSPSDSGYGTVSHASRVQVEQSKLAIVGGYGNNDDDIETVYTEFASHSDVRTESYIDMFADDLFRKMGGTQLSTQMVQRLSNSLPTLLKALALTIGHQSQSQVQRDMMVFIHKQREAITRSFTGHYNHCHDLDSADMTTKREPKSTEIMDRWLASRDESKFETFETERPGDVAEVSVQEDCPGEPKVIPELEDYRKVLVDDPSYMWMLARLHRDLILSTGQNHVLDQIRNKIQTEFPNNRNISRRKPPEEVQVTFTVYWDILSFLHQQNYDVPHPEAIENCVTLTGASTHAQALTCKQYMAQMWPFTGMQTLKLIQEALKTAERRKKLFFLTPCCLTLEVSLHEGSFVRVKASGLPHFIAEIGEQLAWLGAALRPRRAPGGTHIYTPYLRRATATTGEVPATVGFNINYDLEVCDSATQKLNGNCWSHLFSNPVIAGGFPILHRQELDTGLEMPLGLMVALTGTKCLNKFGSTIFIKGFNTMLVPIRQSEGLIIWHLLHTQKPSTRIAYLLPDFTPALVTKTDLEKSRHVLGWCADATSIVGTTLATYDIGRSRLPKAHSHHMLEKVEISAGQFVTGTAAFTLGNREKPVHITRYGFLTKLQWISSKYMVLWDQGDKRGWLVNGASALLHILRASLAHSKRKFQSAWLLDLDALKDPPDLTRPDASLQVLIDEKNRDLTLYMDKTEVYEENVREGATTNNSSRRQTRHYRLEDRIEHIYNILEKLIDHQADVERRSGLQINVRPRQHLEGWDFKDLVKDGDPIFPRVATLPTIGKGWVDFTRAIHAVTLFGTGFGELIQPRQTKLSPSICSRWSLLPKDSYYLAACVSNLLEIMEEDGDATSNPRRLCDNIIWHMKQATFGCCPCTIDPKKGHHDPVQVLFPLKFTANFPRKAQVELKSTGAVIFGHNMRIHWYWKDFGHPVKGDPPMEPWATIADTFEDSGIGSSLSSSRLLSASDPSSAGSIRAKSPAQSQLSAPPSYSEIMPPRGMKRTISGIISTVSKKARQ